MVELFKERLCELGRGLKHLFDVTLAGHSGKQLLQSSWKEIRWELNASWTAAKEKVDVRGRQISFSPLVFALLNIHANTKDSWKYVGSDSYSV